MLGCQANDRDITFPATIATCVAEFHAAAGQANTFDGELCDFGDRDIVAGCDVKNVIGRAGQRVCRQDCIDDVIDMNVTLALAAVPQNAELGRIFKQPSYEIEADSMCLMRSDDVAKAKGTTAQAKHETIGTDQRLTRKLAGPIGRNRSANSMLLARLDFAQVAVYAAA